MEKASIKKIAGIVCAVGGLLLALLFLILGIAHSNDKAQIQVPAGEGNFLITAPGLLNEEMSNLHIKVSAPDTQIMWGIGNSKDVQSYVENSHFTQIKGMKDGKALLDTQAGDTEVAKSDAAALKAGTFALSVSDMWLESGKAENTADITYKVPEKANRSLIIATSQATTPEITISWKVQEQGFSTIQRIFLGILISLIGLYLLFSDGTERQRLAYFIQRERERRRNKAANAAAETTVLPVFKGDLADPATDREVQVAHTNHALGAAILPSIANAEQLRNRELAAEERIVILPEDQAEEDSASDTLPDDYPETAVAVDKDGEQDVSGQDAAKQDDEQDDAPDTAGQDDEQDADKNSDKDAGSSGEVRNWKDMWNFVDKKFSDSKSSHTQKDASKKWERVARKVFPLIFTCVFVAACSAPNSLQPAPNAAGETILPKAKFQSIVEATAGAAAEADAALDVNKLGGRIANPLLAYRSAQYELKKIRGESWQLPQLVLEKSANPIFSGAAFPRTAAVVAEPAAGQNLNTLTFWRQAGPRGQYQLWGQTGVFPSAKLPNLQSKLNDVPGFPQVEADKYAVDPAAVLPAYVEYNKARKLGDIKFTTGDLLYTEIAAQQDSLTATVGNLGTVKTTFAPGEHGIAGVATEDDGLVIMGEMRYNVEITRTVAGAKLQLRGDIGAMFTKNNQGVVAVDHPVTASYGVLVSFYIPPADAKDKTVAVIGASIPTLLSVTKAE
ncbi:hypothetical protein [uncultured Arcanobacterium sp.]|uniref:hypothetical protein n=1 Tax=uncultured Arcanobacterium sp. TaxID=487520 RepID=UPI00263654DE|nr:hypothetical protein [uncultured Arcanobacterium sp.]